MHPTLKRETMENLTPRPVEGHDELTTGSPCERCASFHTLVPQNWHDLGTTSIGTISIESLRTDCALCAQFRHVFEWFNSECKSHYQIEELSLSYRTDTMSCRNRGTTIGLLFDSYVTLRTAEFFPMQSTEFAHLPVVHRKACLDEPDYQFIRTQLDICNKFHGQTCGRSTGSSPILRVIDCKSRQLVAAKSDEPYVCLSYVWGSGATQEPESFGNELPADMPKTIEDAMAVAIALEIPFLWVDRYCIDQGNLQEKHNIIQNMNKVYEGAEITIIAAMGDDPHYGLPGVLGTLRKSQLTLDLANTVFVTIENIYAEINTRTWARRGWTHQEMLLSRRRLVFTNTQMYFQCGTMHCMESLHPSFTASGSAMIPHFQAFPPNGIGHTTEDLQEELTGYYGRELSFDTDIISAFEGIVGAFDQSKRFPFRVTQFYGVLVLYNHDDEHLARKSFVSSLSWTVSKDYENVDGPIDERVQTNLFPSWSWASTKEKSLRDRFLVMRSRPEMTGLGQCGEVKVHITHKTDGEMDPSAFFKHKDSYEMFLPSIKLTTWVLQCPLRWNPVDEPVMLGCELRSDLQPDASCHTLHLAYLGTSANGKKDIWVLALILEEVKPGVFRRIGLWNHWFHAVSDGESAYDMLVEVLEEVVSDTMIHSWLPGEQAATSQLKWEMQDMTIV